MANITVVSDGYWGDDSILSGGSFSNLVWNDTVGVAANITCTIDPSVRPATNLSSGVQLSVSGVLNILNPSTTTALLHMGPNGTTKRMSILTEGRVYASGNFIQIGVGSGIANQVLTGWTSAGFLPADEPSHVEVYNSETNNWDVWLNIAPFTLLTKAGTGECGRWFEYNTTNGEITFGDSGKPTTLTSDVAIGDNIINVTDASSYIVGDWIHIIDNICREPHPVKILDISTNTITIDRTLYYSHLTSNTAYIRKTYGGNILPLGAQVRVYNIGIGCIDSSGNRIYSTNSSTGDYGLHTGGTTSSQAIDWSNLYLFGFYSNYELFPSVKLTNVGMIQAHRFYGRQEASINRLVKSCTGKYNTNNAMGLHVGNTSYNITLTDSYFVGSAGFYSIGPQYPIYSLTFIGGEIYYLGNRINNTTKALYLSAIGAVFNGTKIIGPVNIVGNNHIFLNIRHCESIAFPDESAYLYSSFASSAEGVEIDGLVSIPDGFIIVGTSASNSCLFRSSFAKILNVFYHWYKTTVPFHYDLKAYTYYLSNVTIDNMYILSQHSSSYATFQNVTVTRSMLPPFPYGNFKHLDVTNGDVHQAVLGLGGFYEFRYIDNKSRGCMGVFITKPAGPNIDYIEISNILNVKLYGAGTGNRLMIYTPNDYVIFNWPWKILGITSFPSDGIINITGTNFSNFILEYQINLGNGWNGEWIELNHTNLSSHNVSPEGFWFKLRVRHTTGSTIDYINRLNWTTNVDYDNYPYPNYPVNITLQNIKDGSRWWVFNETTNKLLATGVQSGIDNIIIEDIPYNNRQELLKIRVRKASTAPYYKPYETNAYLNSNGADIYVVQELDNLSGG